MDFVRKPVKFSLKDVGSEIIDQLSRDIYTTPEAMLGQVIQKYGGVVLVKHQVCRLRG